MIYVVKVANTADSDDDFYTQFEGHVNADGEGAWQEVAQLIFRLLLTLLLYHTIISPRLNEFVVRQAEYTSVL